MYVSESSWVISAFEYPVTYVSGYRLRYLNLDFYFSEYGSAY